MMIKEFLSYDTIVIGSGAAGLNALNRLHDFGRLNIALITEDMNRGTSRNTGSDKQTYYKMTLSGGTGDSVVEMAHTLFDGECVDGDIALTEAALSIRCFLNLVENGVPFPTDRYGQFVGYKTDHDPRERGTSVGPLTSKCMTEALEKAARRKGITILDKKKAVRILTKDGEVRGLLCLNLEREEQATYTMVSCNNIILATGGPAGIYKKSVYPLGHYGSSSLAFQCGVKGKNLTEWQYGIVSIKPRWNVSGTFMQSLPRFISMDQMGNNPKDFLKDFFKNPSNMIDQIFKKGYQWPFDIRKAHIKGSSIIDILVYKEIVLKKRRVFLDYNNNPEGVDTDVDFDKLSEETFNYLSNAKALLSTPIERLMHMNKPAYEFYLNQGVDLKKDLLEVDICTQHNNGGIEVNTWWESSVNGLFVCGEAACTHGVYRPGGAALNSGQVGSTRAAQYISSKTCNRMMDKDEILQVFQNEIEDTIRIGKKLMHKDENILDTIHYYTTKMSECAGPFRNKKDMKDLLNIVEEELRCFSNSVDSEEQSPRKADLIYRLYDILLCQKVYLSSYIDYAETSGMSRGSSLYYNNEGELISGLDEIFRFKSDDGTYKDQVQIISLGEKSCKIHWRKVREIPSNDLFFENVWQSYRENRNIY